MALSDTVQIVTDAFKGVGVDEKCLIENLGKWKAEEGSSFRKSSDLFEKDNERNLEHWRKQHLKHLQNEFLRFNNAVVWWTMHPWERDARLVKKAIKQGSESYGILVEVACSRSSDDLLGARKAYHSLFHHSIEEDVAFKLHSTPQNKLLVALVSAYRYEGGKVKEDHAKSDAKTLASVIKNNTQKKSLVEDEQVLRILTTKSKLHLKEVCEQYKNISDGKNLDEDFGITDLRLQETVQCLCAPQKYFTKVLEQSLQNNDGNKRLKKAVTRVIVTRADNGMKDIKEEFKKKLSVDLSTKIGETSKGNYKDFLLALIERGN
ncbi:hypothetical protein CsatB_009848 [Cannabis sativa]